MNYDIEIFEVVFSKRSDLVTITTIQVISNSIVKMSYNIDDTTFSNKDAMKIQQQLKERVCTESKGCFGTCYHIESKYLKYSSNKSWDLVPGNYI